MDNHGGFGNNATSKPSRKRRSNLHHRTPIESDSPLEYRDSVSLSPTPSDHVNDAPSEGHEAINWRKGLNPSECVSRASYANLADAETVDRNYGECDAFEESIDPISSIDDNPAEALWNGLKVSNDKANEVSGHHSETPGTEIDGIGTGNKYNKVKLKVGGVTHTLFHAKSSSDGSSASGTSAANSAPPDAVYPSHTVNSQFCFLSDTGNFNLRSLEEKGGLRGVPWKDFSRTGFGFGKADLSGVDIHEESAKKALRHGRSSKTEFIINKYSVDKTYDEDEDYSDDDEIRYLQKLKTSKIASYENTEYEDKTRGKKLRKISKVMGRNMDKYSLGAGDYDTSKSVKESKKSRSGRASEDIDYMEEEELVSDGEIELKKNKQRKLPIDTSEQSKGSSITTRRRAILTGRDSSPALAASPIQFPDGWPPAPPKKQKEQLTEVEQQLKRAEAAQRRRIQNEKAARESEAEAIRKILGQDSSRKRREEKIKKRQEELAQERTANSATVASNAVRWVMGPSGTVVTFPDEMGLPSIFEPKSSSYPPPREKCAGPSCTNAYKYRDSKSKLPLCSLQCYKAIHEKGQPLHAC